MECIFINYNVELVLSQALLGSPFEPHPHQNSNGNNGTEIDELVISVLLHSYVFISLLVYSILFCFFNFFFGMSITGPMSLERNLIANKKNWRILHNTILAEITPYGSL